MDKAWLLERVMIIIPLILSLTVHEFFPTFTAWKLGDDTAARAGRLTLNPIPHIDPIGTLLLPLAGVPFGWAKPVPVDVSRIRRGISMSTGNILISAAGPLSNLGLALVSSITFGALVRFAPDVIAPGGGAYELLVRLVFINVALAIFNLLPIPPLDGSHVADALMPFRWRGAWESFARFGPFLLLAFFFFGRGLLTRPIYFVVGLLQGIINVVAGV